MASFPSESLISRLIEGELRALSRLITRVENGDASTLALLAELWPRRSNARILGVTGPPGSGKSTFVDRLIARLRSAGHRVAVLAVDPSSPFTGGAILGDRIRMQSHAADSGVFIRSLGTRGHHGGLSRTTHEAAILCAAAGFDRVLIETVGVGQTELEVVGVADQVLVLLVPESGDVVQTMKAGLLEGADVFAVNKCDRPGADLLIRSLVAMIEDGVDLHGDLQAPVFGVSALGGEGMDALLDELCVRLDTGRISPRQLGVVEWTARLLGEEVARRASVDLRQRMAEDGDLAAEAEALQKGQTNPYSLVRALLDES
jgi:LAO/AO transport system kinase